MGDFNAEPYEAPFSETALRAVRFFSTALWTCATPRYLYNTAWRHLPEPDLWETVEANPETYKPSRPRTSFDRPPKLYDQLLVSGRALRGGPITLIEGTVTYHIDVDTCGENLKPLRWNYQEGTMPMGASDHFPLLSTFRINGDKQ
jgi:hypothetical protein